MGMTRSCLATMLGALVMAQPAPPVRTGVVSGRVTDEFGDPVIGARVSAETPGARDGRTVLRDAILAATSTDDRGEYRLAGVPPGDCVVAVIRISGLISYAIYGQVIVSGGRPEPERIYYPGTATPSQAEALTIVAGEERERVDFVLRADPPALPPVAAMRIAQAGGRPRSPDATATIRGRVSAVDGRAVPHAHVELAPESDLLQSAVATADAGGAFEFRDLLPGRFRVVATKPGYAARDPAGSDAAVPASARTVELAAQETRERVDLALARWAAMSGTIVNEAGTPVRGAGVQLLQIRYSRGRRRLGGGQGASLTDDRGRYRIFAVPPGQYVVSATVGGAGMADLSGYARVYYPGTSNAAGAQFVTISRSQELTGIDMPLTRTRTARVSGQVVNAAGVPTNPGSLTLIASASSDSLVSVPSGARISGEGAFEFRNVAPGQYVIRAERGRVKHREGEFGTIPVAVDGADVTGLVLKTSTGSTIAGSIRFDAFNGTLPPVPSAIELAPMPIDYDLAPSNIASAEIRADWTFQLNGINGPRRLQLLRVPPGWMLKEVRVRRADATDRPILFGRQDQSLSDVEVVLTDRISRLDGAVVDGERRGVARAQVMVFSTDRAQWYAASRFMRRTVADGEGTFAVAGLPLGSYYAVALARLPFATDEEWQDPAFLESMIRRAVSVMIGEAQTQTITLRATSP
jgi:protocatechuate 3,4-dioxygenase beta subunit